MIELTISRSIKANAELNALLSDKVYASNLPENITFPCVLVQSNYEDIEQVYSGLSGEFFAKVQVDIWSSSPDKVNNIKKIMLRFLSALKGELHDSNVLGVFDLASRPINQPNEHRITIEFNVHYEEIS